MIEKGELILDWLGVAIQLQLILPKPIHMADLVGTERREHRGAHVVSVGHQLVLSS